MHHPRLWVGLIVVALGLCALVWFEARQSPLQSWFLTRYAESLSYELDHGASEAIEFPSTGPFNVQRGYTRIPEFRDKLLINGYTITEQARFSDDLLKLVRFGVSPPYRELPVAGLVITDLSGDPMYNTVERRRVFRDYTDVPQIIVDSITFIEDRDLINPTSLRTNPVVNWPRFYKAAMLYGAEKLGFPVQREGGSTLATQLEKYRYSESGRTASVVDKLKQITAASLKVYSEGTDTRQVRREIVVDYLNTVPLAAVSGYGEVHGLLKGLEVWFGLGADQVLTALDSDDTDPEKVETYKKVLSLLASVRAPSYYLLRDFPALEERVNSYVRLMAVYGVLDAEFADSVVKAEVFLSPSHFKYAVANDGTYKSVNKVRSDLSRVLSVPRYYDLDRLNMQADSTIDADLQKQVAQLLVQMKDRGFLRKNGLTGKRLLSSGDPEEVIYSVVLYETTPFGNELRVHVDSNKQPFDINTDMKLDLGSTAKLRTLVHYMDVMDGLFQQYSVYSQDELKKMLVGKKLDPLTLWSVKTLAVRKPPDEDRFLDKALDRKYSANPYEQFFTAGGMHTFGNFSRKDNSRRLTLRQATVKSTNLVFIRLMRDLVRYHVARLGFDTKALLASRDDPLRLKLLQDGVNHEVRLYLRKYHHRYSNLNDVQAARRLLGRRARSARHMAMMFYAWYPLAGQERLAAWLERSDIRVSGTQLAKLARQYGSGKRSLEDFGYMLRKPPMEIWAAGKMVANPELTRAELVRISGEVRDRSYAWLFRPGARSAQRRYLRIQVERLAFERMSKGWKKLGYPFRRLVPSYATALGSSSDRPAALAELMGILVNGGIRYPQVIVRQLSMARDTPYHTTFEKVEAPGERVLARAVADKVRALLANVVDHGTARRVSGVYKDSRGKRIPVGGKTGSGDNRVKKFDRSGRLISAVAVNRTATFVFYLGERYFGVITAFVKGKAADNFTFTSSLPVAMLKQLAPVVSPRLNTRPEAAEKPGLAGRFNVLTASPLD